MNNREILFGLNETQGIGWETIYAVRRTVRDLTKLPEMSMAEIRELPLPEDKKMLIYQGSRAGFIEQRLQLYAKGGYRYFTRDDEIYPEWLKHIAKPPWILYYYGDIAKLARPMLGIVGTRMPTAYGKRVAFQFASQLSELGWCIVSGLARGIDSEAHLGALSCEGGTAAVLGTPIDVIYPRENAALFRKIGAEGIVVSEYAIGTVMKKGMFPSRNRIIAGLCMGLLVVEADLKSGSLITADAAFAEDREVFAIPGPVSSPKSRGTNNLIKDTKARLVTDCMDLLSEFQDPGLRRFTRGTRGNDSPEPYVELSEDEKRIVSFLSDLPVTFDRLYELTQFDFGHLHSVLISLLMKKKIEQHPGPSYILTH